LRALIIIGANIDGLANVENLIAQSGSVGRRA
jgi:hypothetical protein